MAEQFGERKNTRPPSKTRKTSQRKVVAVNGVMYSDPQGPRHNVHSSTIFPLFPSSVCKPKPMPSQSRMSPTASATSTRNREPTKLAPKTTMTLRGEKSRAGTNERAELAEKVSTQIRRRDQNKLCDPDTTARHHVHSSTSFPLFPSSVCNPHPTPSQSHSSPTASATSTRNREATKLAPKTTITSRGENSRAGTNERAELAEKVSTQIRRRDQNKLCDPDTTDGPVTRSSSKRLTATVGQGNSIETTCTGICPVETVDSDGAQTPTSTIMLDTPRGKWLDCTRVAGETEDYFPMEYLPVDCKLKVFSYLSSLDKGRCAQVCVEWWSLIRTPGIWNHVNFSTLPFWCVTADEHNCAGNCFVRYRVRIKQFIVFLKDLRPILRSLEFKFDIGENADGFLPPIEDLIEKANTSELKYAAMNWRETPCRPFWTDVSGYMRCDEMMQKHRLRQRLFVNFIDLFTRQCPNVETLIIPFDWSERSVDCLLRLKHIHNLVLEKYFVFQNLCQDLLDKLLLGFPDLRQLMLEIWTPSGHGLEFFSIISKSVEYLDISQSRGFYLRAIHLPRLKRFRVARHPWNGPLVLSERIGVPCLYDVLACGAPMLEQINEHYLKPRWQEKRYPVLEEVLKSVCSCRQHKSGWAM